MVNNLSSYMITLSAVCKLRPRPPALIDKMKTMYSDSLALKSYSKLAHSLVSVLSLKSRYFHPSMTLVIGSVWTGVVGIGSCLCRFCDRH